MHVGVCRVLCANPRKTDRAGALELKLNMLSFSTVDKDSAMIPDSNRSFKMRFALRVQGKEWSKKSSDCVDRGKRWSAFFNLLVGSDSACLSNLNFVKDKITK